MAKRIAFHRITPKQLARAERAIQQHHEQQMRKFRQWSYTIEAPLPNWAFDWNVKVDFPDGKAVLDSWFTSYMRNMMPVVAGQLNEHIKSNMSLSVWSWGDGSRDLVDSGELRESQQVEVDGFSFAVSNDAEYAAITHYGGYINPYGNSSATKVHLPGRPWITASLQGDGPVPGFNWNAAFNKIT